MKSNRIIIFSDSELATNCHRFFTKYGFEVSFFVFDVKREPKFFDVPVFQFDETGDETLLDSNCPIIIASSNPSFKSSVKKRLQSLTIERNFIFEESLTYSPWLEKLVDALSFNNKSMPNEYVAHLLDIHPEGLDDAQSTIKTLADYVSQKIRQDINVKQKTLAVYYPSPAYRMNLGSKQMYDKIRKQGYNVIYLFGIICDDEFEKRPFSYYAGHDIVNFLDFVDVFIIPTLMLGLPERAKKVLFLHDIYDSPSGKAEGSQKLPDGGFQCASPFLDELDYVFVPCFPLMPKNNKSRFRTKKPLCWIPGGYIKLDHNIRYFENNKLPIDSIIYAPTVTNDDFARYVSLPEYGEKIVKTLLNNFSDYRIIFRPHPHSLDTLYVKKIVKHFSGHPRFVFDNNAGFYMDNYCRSAMMVTDMSGTAFTYAFTTLRPVVFFSQSEGEVTEAFGHIRYFQDRNKVGYVVSNIDDFKQKVALVLKNVNDFERRIRKLRDSTIFNVGRAEGYFAENFHYIAEGKKHKDWEYVIPPLSQKDSPKDSISKTKSVRESKCVSSKTEVQEHIISKGSDLAEEACRAVERWANGYFSPSSVQDNSALITVDFSDISLNNPWANGQVPLIYQHRDEMKAFLQVIIKKGLRGTILDIGLEYGGTHVLFREIFENVISVDIDLHKILNFLSSTAVDERSTIICGDSNHRNTVTTIQKHCGYQLDALFIDGGHSYDQVYSDYKLYRNLVREGGIIAFHDTASRDPSHIGIHIFLTQLRNGEIDGVCHDIIDIIKSGTGISYEIKERTFKLDLRNSEDMSIRIRDLEKELEEKDENIAGLSTDIKQRDRKLENLRYKIEQKVEDNKKLNEMLDEQDKNLQNLRDELAWIKSTLRFRLFPWMKKHSKTGKAKKTNTENN